MLTITVPAGEFYNQQTETFETIPEQRLQLEHSLVSVSKWESKWKKPFLDSEKTAGEMLDYIRCMTITPNVSPLVYLQMPAETIRTIQQYINDPMTATTFTDRRNQGGRPSRERVTSELIYYWMLARDIPWECQKWHLNRLMTLIRICDIKDAPQKKMGKRDILSQYAALNASRKAQHRTRG